MAENVQNIDWGRTALLLLALFLVLIPVVRAQRNLKPAQRDALITFWSTNVQELVGIPAALLLFWGSTGFLRWWDPTSAVFDPAVLQVIPITLCHLLVANSVARFGSNINLEWFTANPSKFNRQWLFVIYLAAYCLLAAAV